MCNGTQNFFAALQVDVGDVSGMASKTRNRFDFIEFLDRLEGEIAARKEVVAVLDNLSTHKTKEVNDGLAEHPRWGFQFTPKARLVAQPDRHLLLDPSAPADSSRRF